jgi:hypothetical protein
VAVAKTAAPPSGRTLRNGATETEPQKRDTAGKDAAFTWPGRTVGQANRGELNLIAHRATEALAEISKSASSPFEPTSL